MCFWNTLAVRVKVRLRVRVVVSETISETLTIRVSGAVFLRPIGCCNEATPYFLAQWHLTCSGGLSYQAGNHACSIHNFWTAVPKVVVLWQLILSLGIAPWYPRKSWHKAIHMIKTTVGVTFCCISLMLFALLTNSLCSHTNCVALTIVLSEYSQHS